MAYSLEQTKIAKRYVNSLFEAVTTKADSESIARDFTDLKAMIDGSADLQTFIKSPLLSKDKQRDGMAALAAKAKFSKLTTNFLVLLAEKRRLSLLPEIIAHIEDYLTRESGTISVRVATARKLTVADTKKIQGEIKASLDKDVLMQSFVDESLIGGIVVQVGSTLIDGSLKTKLDRLERNLTAGGKAA